MALWSQAHRTASANVGPYVISAGDILGVSALQDVSLFDDVSCFRWQREATVVAASAPPASRSNSFVPGGLEVRASDRGTSLSC